MKIQIARAQMPNIIYNIGSFDAKPKMSADLLVLSSSESNVLRVAVQEERIVVCVDAFVVLIFVPTLAFVVVVVVVVVLVVLVVLVVVLVDVFAVVFAIGVEVVKNVLW